jgi:type IV pilus assembly protein PilE
MENRLLRTLKKGRFRVYGKGGFTLVELVVVVAIVAILAVVATPAYINYVNRTKQGQAVSMLLTARLEQEEFFADNQHYASTIQCLPSFNASANTSCLGNCSGCNATTVSAYYYTFNVSGKPTANTQYYQVTARTTFYGYAQPDVLTISSNTVTPTIQNTNALHFSVFQWLFQSQ